MDQQAPSPAGPPPRPFAADAAPRDAAVTGAGRAEAGVLAATRPPLPTLPVALWRGARNRCPVCEGGPVFAGFLKVVPQCQSCGTPLGELRADDAPPYFTIFIVGHLLLPPVFWVEKAYQPPMWVHMVVWLPLFAAVCTLMLRPIKGATVGLMLKLGFGGAEAIPLRNQGHVVTAKPEAAAAVQQRAEEKTVAPPRDEPVREAVPHV
ncbi:DUF983 domain-containing protein [Roseomonas elaeocarpi]|uniref:DUF983 domain-containing protein n=1 Tax=Roseomonas elaeocarpi TaxID=907779 RepID=A0ABV6JQG7_9PROT